MVQPHLPSWVPGQQGGSCAGCLPQRTKTQALSLARRRPMGAQVLVGPLAGLTAPLVSSIPSRAKILGCDGWGPRAPPSIPSSFPGPRAGPGNSLQPVLPCHPLAGRALLERQTGSMLPCCGLSTPLGRAVCQSVQVPAWIPAPSQGACLGGASLILVGGECTCLVPSSRPTLGMQSLTLSILPGPLPASIHPSSGVDQTLDSTPTPNAEPRDAPLPAFPRACEG